MHFKSVGIQLTTFPESFKQQTQWTNQESITFGINLNWKHLQWLFCKSLPNFELHHYSKHVTETDVCSTHTEAVLMWTSVHHLMVYMLS